MRSKPLRGAIVIISFVLFLPGLAVAQSGREAAGSIPEVIPVFPLPDVTLFPNTTQPFHIFEPRYRAMVADALAGDSIIGMVTLEPGFENDYEGRPPIYAVGCAGIIVASEQLADGRYNIVVKGVTRFRVLAEDQSRSYRLASVEALPEVLEDGERSLLARSRRQLEEAVIETFPGARLPPDDLADEEFVDGLALRVPMEPAERQRLLEAEGALERASALLERIRGGGRSSL